MTVFVFHMSYLHSLQPIISLARNRPKAAPKNIIGSGRSHIFILFPTSAFHIGLKRFASGVLVMSRAYFLFLFLAAGH